MKARGKRRARIKKIIRGTKEAPRLVIFRSSRFLYAQLINDVKGETLAAVNRIKDAKIAGEEIATKARELKIKKIVFDRAGYKYHGKVKTLAEAARSLGLEF